jgi:hypothetical protein
MYIGSYPCLLSTSLGEKSRRAPTRTLISKRWRTVRPLLNLHTRGCIAHVKFFIPHRLLFSVASISFIRPHRTEHRLHSWRQTGMQQEKSTEDFGSNARMSSAHAAKQAIMRGQG